MKLLAGISVLLVAIITLGALAKDAPPDELEQRQIARELLMKVYHAPETERFCTANPAATYRVTVDKLTFDVDCRVRNEFVALERK